MALATDLIEVPPELIETALGLELGAGDLVADTLDGRRAVFLAGLYRAEQSIAERLRALVLERGAEHISAAAETLLMFAARSIHLDNRIRPALRAGTWVICDRYTDATRAYQGGGRGVAPELIEPLAAALHGDLWPHRTLLLDIPVEQGIARARSRRQQGDRFEDEDRRFFERVRTRYLQIAASEPQRVRIVDATDTPAQVAQCALVALADLLPPQAIL